jgi:hypothetical protein
MRGALEEATIGYNNTYYFAEEVGNASPSYLRSYFPKRKEKEFSCKEIGEPIRCRLNDTLKKGFSTFDV